MFSDLIVQNSRRSRKENGLFFSSLVISVIAFYMVLSVSSQEVMLFLRRMESDAVDKLMLLIPVFYGATLVILFFLIYFACKYQLERRRHEFGVYLMLGMRKSKLFAMLLAEDALGSILALIIGLPTAIALSEIVSLLTTKLVGMGIIGHQFSVSLSAVEWTLAGFLAIKCMALLILSGKICRQEVGSLLNGSAEKTKKERPFAVYALAALCGILMLARAYIMALQGLSWMRPIDMAVTLLLGLFGMLLLFYGMRVLIALIVRKGEHNHPLHVFTLRQIEENVISKSSSMSVSALLILAALCCFGAGTGIAITNNLDADRVIDYTFEETPNIRDILQENDLGGLFSEIFEMKVGQIRDEKGTDDVFEMDELLDTLGNTAESEDRDILLNNLGYAAHPYLICLSDYNHLLELAGKPTLELAENEAAVYIDASFTNENRTKLLNAILSQHPKIRLIDDAFVLTGEVESVNLVVDRSITLSFALIVPDEAFGSHTAGDSNVYMNAVLDENAVSGSLMLSYLDINEKLSNAGIQYQSYLQNMGRRLFYIAASGYITLYLAIVFMVVANTIMGVQFLMNQQKTGRRYQTLIRLGASYEALCRSAGRQVMWFIGLPVAVAAVSSLFGVRALLTGFLASYTTGTVKETLIVAAAMISVLFVVEWFYIRAIKRAGNRYLLTLMEPTRGE